jgi:L-asparaginase II
VIEGSLVLTRLAEVTRGGIVESVHEGMIAVVDVDGNLVASAGDPEAVIFYRSSAKPFQAIPVIESGAADHYGFTPAELALCCASHYGSQLHQSQVTAMLAKLDLNPAALQCGAPLPADDTEFGRIMEGLVPRSPLHCDCSGKHTGMIATALHLGLPIEGYLELEHPIQQRILQVMAEVCRVPVDSFVLGTDGCSVPTFGAPIRAFATSWAALAAPERVPEGAGRQYASTLNRLREAMIAFPENVSGNGALVATIMHAGGGDFVCKSGAEGLICLGVPAAGLGIAIRVADGSFRAHAPIVVSVLEQLGLIRPEQTDTILSAHSTQLRNHNGRHVGDIRAAFELMQ